MKNSKLYILTAILTTCALPLFAGQANELAQQKSEQVKFSPVQIYIDTGDEPLAAYQFELSATAGQVKIVGVEGGEHPAFANPPYYDPAALQHDRIIVAAFSTSKDLPKGKTRVATLHLQILGDTQPQYEIKLTVAANTEGEKIPGTITFDKGGSKP